MNRRPRIRNPRVERVRTFGLKQGLDRARSVAAFLPAQAQVVGGTGVAGIELEGRLQPRFHPRNGLIIGGIGDFLHRLEPLGRAFDLKTVHVPFQIVVMNL